MKGTRCAIDEMKSTRNMSVMHRLEGVSADGLLPRRIAGRRLGQLTVHELQAGVRRQSCSADDQPPAE